jgi:acetoin utilization deacetylase AcuC-like enzyme
LLKDLLANPDAVDAQERTAFDVAGVGVESATPNAKVVRAIRSAICQCAPSYQTLILHHEDCTGHATPEGHFEGADRIDVILNKLKSAGLLLEPPASSPLVREDTSFPRAEFNQLRRCHSDEYIRFLNSLHDDVNSSGKEVSFTPRVQRDIKGVSEPTKEWSDTVFTKGSLAAALRATGGACYAVEQVLSGQCRNAMCIVRPPGHHAGIDGLSGNSQSCGFCIFNTVAIAAMHALEGCGSNNVTRVAIVDFDVHHGQGTDEVLRLYNKPDNIMFFSSHLVHCCPKNENGVILQKPNPSEAAADETLAFREIQQPFYLGGIL